MVNNVIKTIVYLILWGMISAICSCNIDDFEHNTICYSAQNSSGHVAKVELYVSGKTVLQYELTSSETWSDTSYLDDIETNFPFFGDSVVVTYNDTVSITHYPWNWTGENVARSIMLEDSWLGGKVEDNYYRYEYTFTDADYQEALEANAKK